MPSHSHIWMRHVTCEWVRGWSSFWCLDRHIFPYSHMDESCLTYERGMSRMNVSEVDPLLDVQIQMFLFAYWLVCMHVVRLLSEHARLPTHSYVTCLIHIWDMTHLYETWLIHMWNVSTYTLYLVYVCGQAPLGTCTTFSRMNVKEVLRMCSGPCRNMHNFLWDLRNINIVQMCMLRKSDIFRQGPCSDRGLRQGPSSDRGTCTLSHGTCATMMHIHMRLCTTWDLRNMHLFIRDFVEDSKLTHSYETLHNIRELWNMHLFIRGFMEHSQLTHPYKILQNMRNFILDLWSMYLVIWDFMEHFQVTHSYETLRNMHNIIKDLRNMHLLIWGFVGHSQLTHPCETLQNIHNFVKDLRNMHRFI